MKTLLSKLIFTLLLLFPVICHGKTIRTVEGIVVKVSDGDTLQLQDNLGTKLKVRLYGIDAPETEKSNKKTGRVSKPGQTYGEEANQALRFKTLRQSVKLDIMAIDQYKRVVGVVQIGNRNINKELVKEGFAWAYRQYLDRPYASEYISLEGQARKDRKGLWQQSNPQPPWEFRKMLKSRSNI